MVRLSWLHVLWKDSRTEITAWLLILVHSLPSRDVTLHANNNCYCLSLLSREMPKRSHTSENPDALTPTNHMHLLCKALGDLGTNCLTVCVWGRDSIGLHVGEANRGWEFMDSSSVFLVPSFRWLPFLPSPLHPSSYKSGFSYVNHHWSPETLGLGMWDKSGSVKKCNLGQWKPMGTLKSWKHIIGS